MNSIVKKNLKLLGFNPSDFDNLKEEEKGDWKILEDLLSNIDEGNIMTSEEAECLEYAEAVGLDDDDIAKKLQESGIDEDILDIDESTIDYLQKKLRSLESSVWDNTLDVLRQQHGKLVKTLNELKEKLDAVNIKAHIKVGEEKWRENWSELQQLFQELNTVNSCEDNIHDKGFPFSEKNLNEFVELVTQYVQRTWNRVTISENTEPQENQETSGATSTHYNSESDMPMQLEIAKPRLNRAHYNSLKAKRKEENIGYIEKLLLMVESQPQDLLSNTNNEDIDVKKLEAYYSGLLNLSEKQAKLQIKEKGILHVLECIKAHRETSLAASKKCIDVLQKQQVLLDLVYVVKILWDQPRDAVRQTLIHCYEYFHQEVTHMKARIACLEEHKKKFESYFDEQNIHPQKLEMLTEMYFPGEEQCSQDLITEYEKKLHVTIRENKKCLIESKMHLSEIEKDVARIQEDLNFSMEKLYQISMGFSASLDTLQARKDERENLNTSISPCPIERRQRLLWVYFMTDIKKLKDIIEELDENPENISFSTPSYVNKFPCFTSTPKTEDNDA